MDCPRCRTVLATRTYEAGIDVDECSNCHGLWLAAGELEQIQDATEKDYAERLGQAEATVERSYEMARQQSRPEIDCPQCGRRMERRECQYASGVLVDFCSKCGGYWLDRDELQSLEEFSERLAIEARRDGQRGFFASLRRLF